MTALGAAASSFVCSSTGSTGVCQGTTRATQQAFYALQTEINRVGRTFGITKIAVDGKIGPKTVSALLMLTDRLNAKLGAQLDGALSALLVEIEGSPTTPRDLALNAEAITAALTRDGAADSPWSVYTAVRDAATAAVDNITAAVQAAPTQTATTSTPAVGTKDNPVVTHPAPGVTVLRWTENGIPYSATHYDNAPNVAPQPSPSIPLGLKIGLGLAAAVILGGVAAVAARPRRAARVAGVGCACGR